MEDMDSVLSVSWNSLARPKSATWACKVESKSMLLDLTSRCTINGEQSWCK
jgi:hypothetical protein